ncbi:MAG TPA: hypothetical protein VMW75_14505 [Thermoanaerobaculia bacterium]|nr:hypothetical protein [Thermoanaerobaculia bacterium]
MAVGTAVEPCESCRTGLGAEQDGEEHRACIGAVDIPESAKSPLGVARGLEQEGVEDREVPRAELQKLFAEALRLVEIVAPGVQERRPEQDVCLRCWGGMLQIPVRDPGGETRDLDALLLRCHAASYPDAIELARSALGVDLKDVAIRGDPFPWEEPIEGLVGQAASQEIPERVDAQDRELDPGMVRAERPDGLGRFLSDRGLGMVMQEGPRQELAVQSRVSGGEVVSYLGGDLAVAKLVDPGGRIDLVHMAGADDDAVEPTIAACLTDGLEVAGRMESPGQLLEPRLELLVVERAELVAISETLSFGGRHEISARGGEPRSRRQEHVWEPSMSGGMPANLGSGGEVGPGRDGARVVDASGSIPLRTRREPGQASRLK